MELPNQTHRPALNLDMRSWIVDLLGPQIQQIPVTYLVHERRIAH